jgi:long-chain acyl-CoA synthetase
MQKISRVFDIIDSYQGSAGSQGKVISSKVNGSWQSYAIESFRSNINLISCGLLSKGIQANDKVAIMSANRPEWNICDFGIMQIGATQVPLYPTLSEQDLKFILNDAEVKIVFVENEELANKIELVKGDLPKLQAIYTFTKSKFEHYSTIYTGLKYDDFKAEINQRKAAVTEQDLLTLIYTSGTTGTPKGVMLMHSNLVSNVLACQPIIPQGAQVALSFLPLSHIFERMVCYLYLYLGISIYYAESLETIGDNLKEVKPQLFTTVPRLLEKVYDKIVAKGTEATGIKHKLFFWSLNLGLKYGDVPAWNLFYHLQLAIARAIVFSKWREALGGEVKGVISGGAALQPRLAKVFSAAGIPVYQGYGLTETSPVSNVNVPGDNHFGTVGKSIVDVHVKIAEDGEILIKGPNVMKGYYKRPDATAEVIDKEGYFHTGDIGEFRKGGYLVITDRKKEIFKTAGGKYIAPQPMENKYKESPLIEQIIVIGENRRFPCALIVPTFLALKEWCEKKGINYTTNAEMIQNAQVIDKFQREIDRYNVEYGHWEQVKKFRLLPKEFSIDAGEMTPKLSLKRKVIHERYSDIIEEIYK